LKTSDFLLSFALAISSDES